MSLDPVSPAVNAVFHAPVVVPLVNAGLPTDGNPAVSIESHAGARFFCEQIASRNGLVPMPWNFLIA
ncbi:MAG: hypothetical protein ACK6DB_12760 [Planctomycetota bacterium]